MKKQINYKDIKSIYYIDEKGIIYSKKNDDFKILACDTDKDGYFRVSLQCESGRRSFRVNRLVAIMFIPNPSNYPIVHHIDGDKKNNYVFNLEWCSVSYNTKMGALYNDYYKKKSIVAIKNDIVIKEFNSIRDCAKFFNVHFSNISKILNRKESIRLSGTMANIDFKVV